MSTITTIAAEPLTAVVGAEVTGVDMANVSDHDIAELRSLWLEYKVLVLRDQHISPADHVAFGRRFGDLEVHPFAPSHRDHPEIVRIVSDDRVQYAASNWHSDVTWRVEPSMGSILRATVIPPAGGDTCFADTQAAYDRLSDTWKERIDGLLAVHDFTNTFGRRLSSEDRAEKQKEYPPTTHPVVRTHPETGRKGIYTNRTFVSHIEGVSEAESDEIVTHLERAVMDQSVQCRVRWQVDTFVMWDNRAVQHAATNDYWPQTRKVERVTIIGDRPV